MTKFSFLLIMKIFVDSNYFKFNHITTLRKNLNLKFQFL